MQSDVRAFCGGTLRLGQLEAEDYLALKNGTLGDGWQAHRQCRLVHAPAVEIAATSCLIRVVWASIWTVRQFIWLSRMRAISP